MKRHLVSSLLLASALGCATLPRPQSLDQSQALSESPNLQGARDLAPQAYAHAEQLRIRAEQAQSDGQTEQAAALAEQSLIAYERAATVARQLELERQLVEAETAAARNDTEVARVAALQAKVADETQTLERSVELQRSAEPRHPIEPETGKRSEARAEAARSIAEAARLLCVAARMVAPQHEQVSASLAKVGALVSELHTLPAHVALERALDARIECLAALTAARTTAKPPAEAPDVLLTKLSTSMSDLHPHQDDRGIVLTDYGTFAGSQLSPHGADVVERIVPVAKASAYPVLVVLHAARSPGSSPASDANPDAITKALENKGLIASVRVVSSPVPSLLDVPSAKSRGRTEFILVTSR